MTEIVGRDDEFNQTISALFAEELGHLPDASQRAAYLNAARHGATGEQMRAWLHGEPEAVAFRTRPKVERLHVEGSQIVTASGKPWTMAFLTGFRDYERFLRGEDIRPLLQETVDVGANGRRVLGMFDYGSPAVQRLYPDEHPEYFSRQAEFFDLYTSYGLYGQWCVFADTQRARPGAGQQQAHWDRETDTLRPIANVILETINEQDSHENRMDFEPSKPAGLLSSRGSNGAGSNPPGPYWDVSDLHSERRGDFALSTTTVHFAIHGYEGEHGQPGFAGTRVPTFVSEPPGIADALQPGRRTNDPRIAEMMGIGCRWGNGGTAHSDCGVQSVLLSPIQRPCVVAFIQGAKG